MLITDKINAVTKNPTDTLVLIKIHGWVEHNTKTRGQDWTAISFDEIAEQISISRFKVKRAVMRLRSRFLAVKKQRKWSRTVNVYQLTSFGRTLCETTGGPISGTTGGPTIDNKKEILNLNENKVSGPEPASVSPEIETSISAEEKEEDMAHSIAEVQGMVKALHAIHKPTGPVEALALVWRKEAKAHFEHELPSLTKAQWGQLKHVLARCPAGKAEAVVRGCLRDWGGFVVHVRNETGEKSGPSSPSVGYLLKHVIFAANFALPKAPKPVKTVEPATQKFMNIPKKEPIPVATLAEVLEPVDLDDLWKD